MLQTETNNFKLIFIHANGFPPKSYQKILDKLAEKNKIENFLLRPLWTSQQNHKQLKDWELFYNDFEKFLDNRTDYIGLGHSIGGNIILRTAIKQKKYFSKIILLDPTLFTSFRIFFWKLATLLNIQDRLHPLSKIALNRKMSYDSYDEMFISYRKKNIFKKIDDENLKTYIFSISQEINKKVSLLYSNLWEYQIYKTGLLKDSAIWKGIGKLDIPCLIIRPEVSNAFLDSSENKIKKLNPKIQFAKIKNSTHLFPLEYPDKTLEIINNFIYS